jgi:uncharacterized RDD family membrane protein YckC
MTQPNEARNVLNPYAPPTTDVDFGVLAPGSGEDAPLASRGSRLAASMIDGMMYMVGGTPFWMGVQGPLSISMPLMVAGALLYLGVLGLQSYRIATRGQTLAKQWLGIKIVKVDGSSVGFWDGVVLRTWVLIPVAFIPFIGGLFGFVDALAIFGHERRCIHDRIAKTRVVVA